MASFQNFWHLQAFKNSLADGEPLDVLLKDPLCLFLGPCVLIGFMQLPLSPLSKGWAREGKQAQSQPSQKLQRWPWQQPRLSWRGSPGSLWCWHQSLCDSQRFLERAHLDTIAHGQQRQRQKGLTFLEQFLCRFWCFSFVHLFRPLQPVTSPFSSFLPLSWLSPEKHFFYGSSSEPGPRG